MDASTRSQLLDLLCAMPSTAEFAGRTALLISLPESLARDESSRRVDLTNVVTQLEQLGGDALIARLIDNALEFTDGTPLADKLRALRPAARGDVQLRASDFDLREQTTALLNCVLSGSGLIGCALRTSATAVQRVLSERLRDELGPGRLSVKETIVLSPTRSPEACASRITLYRPELARRDVLVPVWAFSTDALAAAWRALQALQSSARWEHNLIAVFFIDAAVLVPADVTELPAPRVQMAELYQWTVDCVRRLSPASPEPEALAKTWARALLTACTDAEGASIDRAFDLLESAVESLRADPSPDAVARLTESAV